MDVLTPRTLDEALRLKAELPGRAVRPGRHRRARRAQLRPLAPAGADQPERGGRAARVRPRERHARARRGAHLRRGDARRRRGASCRRWPRRRARSARRRSATAARSAATSARPRPQATRCRRCSSRTPRCEVASVRGERRLPLARLPARREAERARARRARRRRCASTPSRVGADVHEGRAAERDGDLRLLARPPGRPRARRAPRGVRLGGADRAARHGAARRGRRASPTLVAESASPIDDVRGTAAYRRHALARAHPPRAREVPRVKIALTVNGERARGRRLGRREPALRAARAARPARLEERLRAGRVRLVLGAPRRHARLLVPRPRSAGRRARGRRRSRGSPTDGALHRVQEAFVDAGAVQCGFCTPGLSSRRSTCSSTTRARRDDEIREALSGNLCRCTGYQKIFDAVQGGGAGMSSRPRRRSTVGRDRRESSAGRTAPPKVKGEFAYSSDLSAAGMLWGHTLRSPHAHARIVEIDISRRRDDARRARRAHPRRRPRAARPTGSSSPTSRCSRSIASATTASRSRSSRPSIPSRRAARPRRSSSTYEPLEPVVDPERATEQEPLHPDRPTMGHGYRDDPRPNVVRHMVIRHGDPDAAGRRHGRGRLRASAARIRRSSGPSRGSRSPTARAASTSTSRRSGCTSTATRSRPASASRPSRCGSTSPASAAPSAAARTSRCRSTPRCSRSTRTGR